LPKPHAQSSMGWVAGVTPGIPQRALASPSACTPVVSSAGGVLPVEPPSTRHESPAICLWGSDAPKPTSVPSRQTAERDGAFFRDGRSPWRKSAAAPSSSPT
jgi:hypothetical protein